MGNEIRILEFLHHQEEQCLDVYIFMIHFNNESDYFKNIRNVSGSGLEESQKKIKEIDMLLVGEYIKSAEHFYNGNGDIVLEDDCDKISIDSNNFEFENYKYVKDFTFIEITFISEYTSLALVYNIG